MPQISKILYTFLWTHSLLIGMFVFFLPIFLWQDYLSITQISIFISLTGISYLAWLIVWDRLRHSKKLWYIIAISFVFEIILISVELLWSSDYYLHISAVVYGIYNCFFWVTQRLMFLENSPPKSIGKQYGTIQILAFILVKIGIILWAFILEQTSLIVLWISVSIISSICLFYFFSQKNIDQYFKDPLKKPVTTFSNLVDFKDAYRSKFIFFLDGPFLFFESFFWVISLFLLSNQSYSNLWIITVVLAISFAIIFMLIRQFIDSLDVKKVYYISTILYAASWILRGYVPEISNMISLGVIVFIIAFCTSFFRLSFNKQFFDLAKNVKNNRYIVIKSYYSQLAIFITFWVLAIIFSWVENEVAGLSWLYYSLWVISLLYLLYKPHSIKKSAL